MNYRMIAYLLGTLLVISAALLLLPMAVGLCFGESLLPFLYAMLIQLALAAPLLLQRPKNRRINAREGFIVAAATWLVMSAFGALPFVFSGSIPNYIDAVFETVSGFTTTGASILRQVENLSRSILFWRSFTHWVGGMGVLVLMLAILPSNSRSIYLMRAEVPGPTKGKLVPQMKDTAKILYGIYIVLSAAEVLALLLTGMPLYDSVVNTFATAGTGGFSVLNNSIAGYANPAAEWIIGSFMLLFGVNFTLFHLILIKKFREAFQSEELRVYLLLCAASVAVISCNVFQIYGDLSTTLRTSFFQVASVVSTTGFGTTDFNQWPLLSKAILVLLSICGACAGSTAGGLKVARVILLVKSARRDLRRLLHPRAVNVVRLDRQPVPEEVIKGAGNYLTMYMLILFGSFLLLSIDNFDLESTFTAVVACFNNIGPGLGMVGPAGNYADFSILSKLVLSFDMLLGRLEIIPFALLLSVSTWTKN